MPRPIDADALICEALTEACFDSRTEDVFLDLIDAQPTIEAEPVRHGTWETSFEYDWDGNKLYIHFHRECGFEYRNYIEDEQPYCPHCGVKMDGGGKQ